MTVVVVGSGLAAVGAIRALITLGHRPLVLDLGQTLPKHLETLRETMSVRSPSEWSSAERNEISRNERVPGKVVPRKLVMGSDYFYSSEQAEVAPNGDFRPGTPPWSPARGGFSVGWGAAVLPPAISDVESWPITHREILVNARLALAGVPLSEPIDELTPVFGSLQFGESSVLSLSAGQEKLLKVLRRHSSGESDQQVLVGQSRLLTDSRETSTQACRKCGLCSAGCVYGSIYSAEQDITRWITDGKIVYKSDIQVFRLSENGNTVKIEFVESGQSLSIEADRVFLATGAVNSARILLNSYSLPSNSATLHRTGGVLRVFAGLRSFELAWPHVNTQTSHLVELRANRVSPYWAHVQMGQPNELVLQKLGVSAVGGSALRQRVMKTAAAHLVTTMLNVNSSHGPRYELRLVEQTDGVPSVMTRQAWPTEGRMVVRALNQNLGEFMRRAKFLKVPFASQDSVAAQGYHFGASFPMVVTPSNDNHTDVLGRPFGWNRIHVVDTSVLPAIPATGVGVVTMANAYRIAYGSLAP